MEKKYKNPPLIEALCEFQFIPGQSWDMTIPGLIYERIKENYPEKKQQIGLNIQTQASKRGVEQKIEPAPPRILFLKKDNSGIIQVGLDLLIVNQLKPYTSWNELKPIILKNLKIYQEIANPKGFKRIGLRYINVLEIDKVEFKLTDYFKVYPYIPDNFPQMPDSFLTRNEFPYEDGKERLILTLASLIPSNPGLISILLDLDYVMATPEYVQIEGISEWLDKAHNTVEAAFEASITDKTRAKFNE